MDIEKYFSFHISRSEETKLNYIDSQFNWISVCDKKKTAPDPQF